MPSAVAEGKPALSASLSASSPALAQCTRDVPTLLAAVLLASYSYYTAWVVLTPFVDREVSWFHDIFPDRYYALAVPTALMVTAVAFVFGFVGIVHLRGGDGES